MLLPDTDVHEFIQLLVGEENKRMEFGAQQVCWSGLCVAINLYEWKVVIVRNDEARRNLPELFQGALVVTVEEGKGLEVTRQQVAVVSGYEFDCFAV